MSEERKKKIKFRCS